MPTYELKMSRQPSWVDENGLRWGLILAALLFLSIWLMPAPQIDLKIDQFAPWHAILEMFSIVVAGSIFAVGWHARIGARTTGFSFVAAAFLAVALIDTAHTLSYSGMPQWFSPSGPNKSIQFWLLARFTATIAILALVARNYFPVPRRATSLLAYSLIYAFASIYLVLTWGDSLPVFFIPGEGLTPLKISMEWILVGIQLLTLWMVWQQDASKAEYATKPLIAALCLSILSELCFTLYSNVTDLFSTLGHIYKAGAYAMLFQAILVTGVKRPYQLLAESQGLLQQLTDNIRQVFWVSTPDKKTMLYVSPAYAEIWGHSTVSLLDRPESWMESIHPEDRGRVWNELEKQNTGQYNVEYRIIRPDGSERWIHDQAFPILDVEGQIVRIAGVAEDITEQKEAVAMLAANESRLRAILETASDGIHIMDDKGTLVDASDSFIHSLGLDKQCFGKTHIWDWDDELEPKSIQNMIQSMIKSGNELLFETHHRNVNGEKFPVEIVARAFRIGNNNFIYAAARNLRERKTAEAERANLQSQLLQAQKMEAIGHLTGGIAHDFNNILGAILGYAELLKQMGMSNSPEERNQKYVGEILTATNRAKELISQMLMFSRLNQDKPDGDVPVTLIQPVVKEVVHLLRSSIPSTIDLNYQISDQSTRIRLHPVQLHQILLNLAINARDAIDEYGRIDIAVEQCNVSNTCNACHQPFGGEFVQISVTDNGRGIPSHVVDKIFDPFFTTKEVGKGTGMGLSVVHGIVHSVGGHILVDSTPGHGAAIRILLPLSTTNHSGLDKSVAREEHLQQSQLSGLRIMVVDDEHAIASMLKEMLGLHGATVTTFSRPAQALADFERNPDNFDLVITDETMPELSGLDMARSMLHVRPGLPIILCTGYSERVSEELAKKHGITAFMYKPIEVKALISRIESIRPNHH